MDEWRGGERDLPMFPREQTQLFQPRRGRRLLYIAGALVVLLLVGKTIISYWVELLWFRSLGYGDVFWKLLTFRSSIFFGFAAITFAFLYCTFLTLRRMYRAELLSEYRIVIGGQPLHLSAEPALRRIAVVGSIVVAVINGAAMMADWPTFALLRYGFRGGSDVDPIFGKPLSFFFFTLPAWNLLAGWAVTLALFTCALALFFVLLTGGFGPLRRVSGDGGWSPLSGLSLTLSVLLFLLAVDVYLGRFQRLLDHHTVFDGVTYTDAHVFLPGLLVVCAALALGGLLAAFSAFRRSGPRQLAGAIAPAALCYFIVQVVGWYVGNFVVKPNELVRETPYIQNNIDLTRRAYGLDRFQQKNFLAETTVAATEPADNQPTLQNIRLWDWRALQDTLRQVQEIRTYYDFPDIDIDRYSIDGSLREVMLATRELSIDKLPESSRNWINEKLVYTHGYGITMNPVNGFTEEGLPTLLLSNMPVQSTAKELSVTRPEIYFGELTDTDVYVKTRQQEFDYPQGERNSVTSYQGNGGIALGSFLKRVLLAFDRDDLAKVPFSDDINAQSRLLMRRNVRDRVRALAPFLTFDLDPYMVVGEDGRLSWLMDAFTTSDNYPYSSRSELNDRSVNYMRNSVKVVIDAYDGTTSFYVFDKEDPILAAYRKMFPSLFKDAAEMPPGLRKHVRYPELLFKLQSEVYGLYHMTDPGVFFNREDLWTVATETGTGSNGEQAKLSMQPNYVLMKLPGEREPEFVEILPFTPANRNNLIGWLAGRSDEPNYGRAIVYDFPKTRLVDGPQQIESRIDQNAEISGQLTLWNQQGSHVRRGSLLVIPTGRALLYAEPIYLQAQESPMPELRLVVLALQDRLAYGPTFEAALGSLFSGSISSLSASGGSQAAPKSETQSQDVNALIGEAGKDFADYQRLTSEGRLAEAGQKLDALKHVIERLNAGRH